MSYASYYSPGPSPETMARHRVGYYSGGIPLVGLGQANKGLMTAGVVVLGVGVLGLIVWLVYQRMKLTQSIAEKHGVGHALAFEGGMAAIGALARNEEEDP